MKIEDFLERIELRPCNDYWLVKIVEDENSTLITPNAKNDALMHGIIIATDSNLTGHKNKLYETHLLFLSTGMIDSKHLPKGYVLVHRTSAMLRWTNHLSRKNEKRS